MLSCIILFIHPPFIKHIYLQVWHIFFHTFRESWSGIVVRSINEVVILEQVLGGWHDDVLSFAWAKFSEASLTASGKVCLSSIMAQ